jgi:hypothetical protein
LPLSAETGVSESELDVAALMFAHVAPPSDDCCHWMAGEPKVVVAAEEKVADVRPPRSMTLTVDAEGLLATSTLLPNVACG